MTNKTEQCFLALASLTLMMLLTTPWHLRAQATVDGILACAKIENDIGRLDCFDDLAKHFSQSGVLPFEINVGVVMKSGDVKKAARTTFYLLDAEVDSLLAVNNISKPIDSGEGYHQSLAFASQYGIIPKYAEFQQNATTVIRRHIKYSATTDFEGFASFGAVKPGIYWLYGVASLGKAGVVWDMKIELSNQGGYVSLDQHNAAFAF